MLEFALSRQYRGIGGSAGLDRGLLVYQDGQLLVEEGMGIGAVALQAGGFTYFASLAGHSERQETGNPVPAGEWTAEFRFDRRLVWKVLGRPSVAFTRMLEAFVTYGYMRFETAQPRLLAFGARLARLFRVDAEFRPIEPCGQATVSYRAGPDAVEMTVAASWQDQDARLFIMNELGGNLFSEGLANGRTIRPPSGWQRMDGNPELYSPELGLVFGMEGVQTPPGIGSTLFWGREMTERYCWAGFECDLRCPGRQLADYRVRVRFRHDHAERAGAAHADEVVSDAAHAGAARDQ